MKLLAAMLILAIFLISGCTQQTTNQTNASNEQKNIQVQTIVNNNFEENLAIFTFNFGPMYGGSSYLRMITYYPIYSEDMRLSNRIQLLKDDNKYVDSFFIGEYRSISASFDALVLVINSKSSKLFDDFIKSANRENSEAGRDVFFFNEESECYYFFTENNTLVISITNDCYLGKALINLISDRARNITRLHEVYPLIKIANGMPSLVGNYTYYQAISYYNKGDETTKNVANPWGENSTTIQFYYNNTNAYCANNSYCYEDEINPRIIYSVDINYLTEISAKLEEYAQKIRINNNECYDGPLHSLESDKVIPFISGGNGNLNYSIVCITNNSIVRTDSLSFAKDVSKNIQERLVELINNL